MLRRAVGSLLRHREVLHGTAGPTAAWTPPCNARALHSSAAALLAEPKVPSSSGSSPDAGSSSSSDGSSDAIQTPQGATESVVFAALARASAAAQNKPAAGVPGVTKTLGFAGVLPFWVFSPAVAPLLPLDLLLDPAMLAATGLLQVGYGATILSFLGGVHWGLAMTNVGGDLAFKMADQRYLWSVLPCLMAWPTIAMPTAAAAGIQAGLFTAVYFVDRSWAGKGLLPPWYINMRLPLTLMAVGGLALTAATS
ncbi:hypothetical protein D9Q98_002857 [Chlorella vulgaris]|uniref:Uncharacterized protein n=1 Tax=Chlorella vulgaris TaxID=3077 RepID=A0A9D4YZN9_CHLVU|nr:hypothetical protein D9Q98_002857 [Chlorella vulgaris]